MPKGIYLALLLAVVFGAALISRPAVAAYGDVTTFVGQVYSGDNGPATKAWLDFPEDVNFDSSGNLYIADTSNNVVRKINTNGIINTYAGSGHYGFYNAPGTAAEFASPKGLAVDSSGNVYVADTDNNQIRKIDKYRSVSTVVGGTLNRPEGLAIYSNTLYIADTGSNMIKKVNLTSGRIDILSADFREPVKIVVSGNGRTLYVTDAGNFRVAAVSTTTGQTTLVAGGHKGYAEGIGSAARFNQLGGIALASNTLYVGEGGEHKNRIRAIDLESRETRLVASDPRMHDFSAPQGLRVREGKLYLASTGNSTIQRYDAVTGEHDRLIAGTNRFGYRNGPIAEALFGRPRAVVQSPDRTKLYVAENNKIRQINFETGRVSFVIGNSIDDYIGEDAKGAAARFSNISAMVISPDGETLYVVDRWNNRIRGVRLADQSTFLVAGGGNYNVSGAGNGYREGRGEKARFDNPFGIAISPNGRTLYVTDTANRRIRAINIATGQTSLVAGSGDNAYADGVGSAAKFRYPAGLSIDSAGKHLFVADRDSQTIRKIRLSDHKVTTLVGTDRRSGFRDGIGSRALLSYPVYVAWASDNRLYFSESGSLRVRLIELGTNLTKLVAGSGFRGYHDSRQTSAKFMTPAGLAVDVRGKTIFLADSDNDVIRRISIPGIPPYTDAAPVVQGVWVERLPQNSNPLAVAYLDVIGAGFSHGAAARFGDYAATTYVKSATALTVVIPIGRMETGWYDVEVSHLDGQRSVRPDAFAVTDQSGGVPDRHHSIIETEGFLPYPIGFSGGVNLASGDVDADGQAEIITAPASNGGPHIRVFSLAGTVESQFFAYSSSERGGYNVTSCDLDLDGRAEIITSRSSSQSALIRIFTKRGNLVREFYAYPKHLGIGANVACGDVQGDGRPELVVAPAGITGPHVKVFSARGNLLSQFFAYPSDYRLGLDVAVGNLNGTGKSEIMVMPASLAGSHVRIFRSNGALLNQFFTYATDLRAAYQIESGDVDGDGRDEIITGLAGGYAPHVRIFNQRGRLESQFYAFSSGLRSGVHVAAGDVNGDGLEEIICTPANGRPTVVVFTKDGDRV